MFKFIKEASGPAIFTKGILRYEQGRYEDSKKLILKAGKWMPDLKTDDIYNATLLLIELKLGAKPDSGIIKEALESLMNSPCKDTNAYSVIVTDLRHELRNNTHNNTIH